MAGGTEQLPAATFIVGGIPTLSGWQIISAQYGFEDDGETKTTPLGQWKADITYSRRQTLKLNMEALTGATVHTYVAGGTIASGVFTKADGSTAVGWKIKSSTLSRSGKVTIVDLDLIALADDLAVT